MSHEPWEPVDDLILEVEADYDTVNLIIKLRDRIVAQDQQIMVWKAKFYTAIVVAAAVVTIMALRQ